MLLLLGEAARTHDGVTIRGRGRSQSSAIFDPRRQHFCRSNIRTASHPCRSGEQALLSSCKERAYRCFHNGTHVVEGAYAISPLPWSRSPRRILGCAILIKPQPRHSVNTPPQKSVHQPICLGTLCIALQIESNTLGTFLARAKEGLL